MKWTLMIMQPEPVTEERAHEAIRQVKSQKALARIDDLVFSSFSEGLAAQVMHKGPFSEEGPTVQKLHAHIAQSGRTLSGKHHEIYLTDVRRAAPENWKTIIRQPMQQAAVDRGSQQTHGAVVTR